MSKPISTQVLGQLQQLYTQHDKKLIFVIVVLLVIYLISVAAKITWMILPIEPVTTANKSSTIQVAGNIETSSAQTNLSELLNLNLFGSAAQVLEAPQQQEVTEAPETQLNLVLSGVVATTTKDQGAAVIAYRNNQATYGIGDQIEGTQVTLDEIYYDRVIIKNRAVRETLMLEGIDFDEANQRLEQDQTSRQAVDEFESRVSAPRNVQEIRQQLQQQPESFTEFIRFTPALSELGVIGFKLSPGNNSELFTALGLQNGDVVTQLNGFDLSDPQQLREATVMLQSEEELILELMRDGQPVSLTIEIPQE